MVEVRRFPDLSRFFISNPTKDDKTLPNLAILCINPPEDSGKVEARQNRKIPMFSIQDPEKEDESFPT